jgi:outer membrane receptor for ferrienterochelin and colicin
LEFLLMGRIPPVFVQTLTAAVAFGLVSSLPAATEAPAAASIVTASVIKNHDYHVLADILASVHDLLVTRDRNYQYIEVRGPGSSIYGSNPFFSLVNDITKRERDYNGREIAGSAARIGTGKERLTHGKRFNNGTAPGTEQGSL